MGITRIVPKTMQKELFSMQNDWFGVILEVMDWKRLESLEQLAQIKQESQEKPVLIFKHSSRCSISSIAWDRLKRNWKSEDSERISPYFLDLISYREISNTIAREFEVYHESPQIILIKEGKAVYDTSHMGINYHDIMKRI